MRKISSLSALILAGGQSSRMGEDKGLLRLGERTLLGVIYEVVSGLTSDVYILTSWPERYEKILPSSAIFLQEFPGGKGPVVALSQGLREIQSEWIFVVACDLPLLKLSVLQKWQNLLGEMSSDILAVVPYYQNRWEPLCGFYRGEAGKSLQSFLQGGGDSFQSWLSQIPVFPLLVDGDDSQVLLNCNTPTEWTRIVDS